MYEPGGPGVLKLGAQNDSVQGAFCLVGGKTYGHANSFSIPNNIGRPISMEDPKTMLKPSAGRWTPREHTVFVEAMENFPKNWKRISSIVGTRTAVQCRTHAQKVWKNDGVPAGTKPPSTTSSDKSSRRINENNVQSTTGSQHATAEKRNPKNKSSSNSDAGNAKIKTRKVASYTRWSPDEHDRFVNGMNQWPKNWKRISELVGTRSPIQCRTHAQKVWKGPAHESHKKAQDYQAEMMQQQFRHYTEQGHADPNHQYLIDQHSHSPQSIMMKMKCDTSAANDPTSPMAFSELTPRTAQAVSCITKFASPSLVASTVSDAQAQVDWRSTTPPTAASGGVTLPPRVTPTAATHSPVEWHTGSVVGGKRMREERSTTSLSSLSAPPPPPLPSPSPPAAASTTVSLVRTESKLSDNQNHNLDRELPVLKAPRPMPHYTRQQHRTRQGGKVAEQEAAAVLASMLGTTTTILEQVSSSFSPVPSPAPEREHDHA
jgi:SHAQKYF class myb-like DNA-binding protein